MPSITSTLLYSKLVKTLMASLRRILVKSESTSRLPMKILLSWCTISSAKAKESLTVNSLNVIKESLGTKNFTSLLLGVTVAESIVRNDGQTSVVAFCTLQSSYKIPGLHPIALISSQTTWFLKTLQIIVYTSFLVYWTIQNTILGFNYLKLRNVIKNLFNMSNGNIFFN